MKSTTGTAVRHWGRALHNCAVYREDGNGIRGRRRVTDVADQGCAVADLDGPDDACGFRKRRKVGAHVSCLSTSLSAAVALIVSHPSD